MRQSPPLRVQGQGGRAWRVATVGLPALTVASLGAWAALGLGLPDLWAGVLASKLAAVTAAALACRRLPVHELAWDGRQWWVDGQCSRLQLTLDLGSWVLLRARPADAAAGGSAPVWLPLAASEAGADWGPLRAAVYARPGPQPTEQQTP